MQFDELNHMKKLNSDKMPKSDTLQPSENTL
jgi:hypothetical protein